MFTPLGQSITPENRAERLVPVVKRASSAIPLARLALPSAGSSMLLISGMGCASVHGGQRFHADEVDNAWRWMFVSMG